MRGVFKKLDYSKAILELRSKLNVSQQDLADLLGVSLLELFQDVKKLHDNPDSILSLNKLMRRCGVEEENVGLKFASSKAYNDIKIYEAKVLPKINIPVPDGVTNIKYDVDCSLAEPLNIEVFLKIISSK